MATRIGAQSTEFINSRPAKHAIGRFRQDWQSGSGLKQGICIAAHSLAEPENENADWLQLTLIWQLRRITGCSCHLACDLHAKWVFPLVAESRYLQERYFLVWCCCFWRQLRQIAPRRAVGITCMMAVLRLNSRKTIPQSRMCRARGRIVRRAAGWHYLHPWFAPIISRFNTRY